MNASSDQGGRICHPSSWPRMRPRILDRCLELHRSNLRSVVNDTLTMPRIIVVNRAELCKSTAGVSSEISAGSGNNLFKGPSTSTDGVGSRTNQAIQPRANEAVDGVHQRCVVLEPKRLRFGSEELGSQHRTHPELKTTPGQIRAIWWARPGSIRAKKNPGQMRGIGVPISEQRPRGKRSRTLRTYFVGHAEE